MRLHLYLLFALLTCVARSTHTDIATGLFNAGPFVQARLGITESCWTDFTSSALFMGEKWKKVRERERGGGKEVQFKICDRICENLNE